MRSVTDRRTILKGALGGLVGVAAPSLALAGCGGGGGSAGAVTATPLKERVFLFTGAGPNVLAVATSDGVVLVDGGAPEHARSVLAAARGVPGGGRLRALFNTHYHLDQTGANEAAAEAEVAIIASERVKIRLSTPLWSPETLSWGEARPEAAWPTETFHLTGGFTSGEERIEYGALPQPHTDGDIYVFFRDANVLAVGDAASPERDPVHDWFAGGWLGGRSDAQLELLTLADDDTLIVPSYGPVMTKAELAAEQAMMQAIHERSVELLRKGCSAADMLIEGVFDVADRQFEDPDRMIYDIWKGLWGHQSSLSHDIV